MDGSREAEDGPPGGGAEDSLRPPRLEDFFGQERAVRALRIALAGAQRRGEALGHVLLHGPPGLGKTTLAAILAAEMGVAMTSVMCPSVGKAADIAGVLISMPAGGLLFLDEVHRLPLPAMEMLYGAMEDFRLDIAVGDAAGARTMSLPLRRFTLVGATTRSGSLSAPFRERFALSVGLELYTPEALGGIVDRSASLLGVRLAGGVREAVARRSRGTPRIANGFLLRLRDYMDYHGEDEVTAERAAEAFSEMGVGEDGMTEIDRRYLSALTDRFGGRPVGIRTLAAALGEDAGTLEWEVEPWLVREGWVERTSRGRVPGARADGARRLL